MSKVEQINKQGQQCNRSGEVVLCPYLKGKIKMNIANNNNTAIINNLLKAPTMKTVKEIMDETGFSYRHLVRLCHEDKIVYIKAGKKFLINYEKFIEYLNTGDKNADSSN